MWSFFFGNTYYMLWLNIARRHASYTVDVYLIKDHPTLGRAGSLIEVPPGYARNTLIPQQYGLLMGEGEYRKKLPILYERRMTQVSKVTPRMILAEKNKYLEYDVVGVEKWLAEKQHLTRIAAADHPANNAIAGSLSA
jgi:hypothetical protein